MKKIQILAFLVFALSSVACKKFLDINTNPSTPQVPSAEIQIAPVIFQMANGVAQDNRVLFKLNQNMFGSSTDAASYIWERHGYPLQSDVGGVMWRMVYVDHGLNIEDMIKDGIANQKYEYVGIAYAIKAWGHQQLTDYHGPIILDEAYTQGMLAFPYHDQPVVYERVRQWADSALKYFDKTSKLSHIGQLSSISGDNLYQGNKEKWRKFIYGLKALQYSHLVNKPEFVTHYADSVIKYVDLSFATVADDALVRFSATKSSDSNPYGPDYGLLSSTYYGRAGMPIVKYLTGGIRGDGAEDTTASLDPRLTRMLNFKPVDSTYIGGLPLVANTSVPKVMGNLLDSKYPGKYIFTNNSRFPIMTYAQLQFAKAEALFLKGNKADALIAYQRGITGHMSFVNTYGMTVASTSVAISAAEINAYLNSSEVAQTAADLTLADIMGQKYICQWGWAGLEQWTDLRKYHYDENIFRQFVQLLPNQINANNGGKLAYRVRPRYNSEYAWNAKELEKWGALDLDYMTKELWFSKATND